LTIAISTLYPFLVSRTFTHASNDKKGEGDSLLAMTIKLAVIASLLLRRRRGNLVYKPKGLKNVLVKSISIMGSEGKEGLLPIALYYITRCHLSPSGDHA
jgi:hypothetical protein